MPVILQKLGEGLAGVHDLAAALGPKGEIGFHVAVNTLVLFYENCPGGCNGTGILVK